MRASVSVGSVLCEVEAEGGYSPDVMADLCTRALTLAHVLITPEQVAEAAKAEDDA